MKKTKKNADLGITKIVALLFSYILVMLVFFSSKDFIVEAMSKDVTYEIRYETVEDLDNGQKIYRLFKNGEYHMDVDVNEYSLLDQNGNTDYRYCALMYSAKKLVYAIFFVAMLLIVIRIFSSLGEGRTPFTAKNTGRIKVIAFLQLAQSIFPGLTVFIMKFVKFGYTYMPITLEGFYNLVLFAVIMLIAEVFAYGVKLQEENDLIA